MPRSVEPRRLLLGAYGRAARLVAGRGLERLGIARRANALVLAALRRRPAAVQGHRMVVDRHDILRLYAKGIYEPFETELVREELRSGDVAFDIGAHIGYFTLLLARAVGPDGHVYAFEPDPENFALLRRNVDLNGYRNVTVTQAAVTDETGVVPLYRSRENAGDHRITNPGDGRAVVHVPAVRLDDRFRDHDGRLDFVKLDVQGAELRALRGMQDLLRRTRPRMLVVEFAPELLERAGSAPAELPSFLEANGYDLRAVGTDDAAVDLSDPQGFLTRGRGEPFTNLLCVRRAA